jgi:hypothetical protein
MLLCIFLTSNVKAGQIDPGTLVWTTNAPDVVANGASVNVGVDGSAETGQQPVAKHFASALLPPASTYTVAFSVNLSSWDSYNAPGTVNPPPFNGGTGYWDSFSLSIGDKPYWQLALTDPLTASLLGDNFFLWGGSSYGDHLIKKKVETITRTFTGNPNGQNYLNVGLDTATLPESDTNYPSWGSFTIVSIEATSSDSNIPRIAGLTSYSQAGDPSQRGFPGNLWGNKKYDSIHSTIRQVGCAMTSLAMVLSKYGYSYTPGTLNTALDDLRGYKLSTDSTRGDVKWQTVSQIDPALEAKVRMVNQKHPGAAEKLLDADLSAGRPVILGVGGHFVVAVGKTDGVYDILDPGYRRVTLAAYGNTFRSMIRFVPSGSGAFVVNAAPSVELLVTDPLGRRVGLLSGAIVNEIPGATYLTQEIKNDEPSLGGADIAAHRVVYIPSPSDGYYSVTASSGGGGKKTVEVYRYNMKNRPETIRTLTFDLTPGAAATQSIPYSTRVGDINGDGYINIQDLEVVEASFGKRVGQQGYNPAADVNGDGIVDVRDLAIVGRFDPPPSPVDVPRR